MYKRQLHDIGAYKTEEINRMTQFESEDVWEHSIYGYLFLHELSPLKEWAKAVMFHHVPVSGLPDTLEKNISETAQMISLADRIDMYLQSSSDIETLLRYLEQVRDSKFDGHILDLFYEAEQRFSLLSSLKEKKDFRRILPEIQLTEQECEDYLKMTIYAIDFRSQHTVTHTITTTSISVSVEMCIRDSCRTLESATGEDGILKAGSGWTEIFIYPGYQFRMIDGLITNFHLPESTLIMLVSAFAGKEHVLRAYEEAVKEKYRFFSFGDAMLIL